MSSGWLRLRTDRDNEKQRKRAGRLLRQGRRWLARWQGGATTGSVAIGGRRVKIRQGRQRRRCWLYAVEVWPVVVETAKEAREGNGVLQRRMKIKVGGGGRGGRGRGQRRCEVVVGGDGEADAAVAGSSEEDRLEATAAASGATEENTSPSTDSALIAQRRGARAFRAPGHGRPSARAGVRAGFLKRTGVNTGF
ncbi:hypothetical protein B296_00005485 [Ensete ventricosum]|uniref:Uncharacterized protein n=1 Tax=Ensete ventricosum TaxID=4639 RepID=A0A427A4F2_ENSVE|nr:hypothetical protein B296_00005485 [Ensete ventricosum]